MHARSSHARVAPFANHPEPERTHNQAAASTLVASAQFTAHARFAVALGVAASCAARDARWARVVSSLCELCKSLGWRVRSAALAVGSAQSKVLVERACDAIVALVDLREGEPMLASRAATVRSSIDHVRSTVRSL
jgi:hypothetical protein